MSLGWIYPDGDYVVFVTTNGEELDVHVRNLTAQTEVVLPSLPSFAGAVLTPYHSKMMAFLPLNSLPDSPSSVLLAEAAGGSWTTLATNVGRWSVSPDSRERCSTNGTAPLRCTQ